MGTVPYLIHIFRMSLSSQNAWANPEISDICQVESELDENDIVEKWLSDRKSQKKLKQETSWGCVISTFFARHMCVCVTRFLPSSSISGIATHAAPILTFQPSLAVLRAR